MSSGAFSLAKYALNDGTNIMPIQVQPETLTFTDGTTLNDPPAGNSTLDFFARARKGTKEYGVGARAVVIGWNGSPPAGYKDGLLDVVILQKALWDSLAIGDTVTYLGTSAEVKSKRDERRR